MDKAKACAIAVAVSADIDSRQFDQSLKKYPLDISHNYNSILEGR